jgi:dihydrofolate reductase
MGEVVLDMTMSLDGFVAGPNVSMNNPMGENGEGLHEWIFNNTGINKTITDEMQMSHGAVIFGKRTFDVGEPHWNGDTPFSLPCFVVTNKAIGSKASSKGNVYHFINEIETALSQAQLAAGKKNVLVMGGASIAQQFLRAGLVDIIHARIVPVLMGKGVRLFDSDGDAQIELERIRIVEGDNGVTHISYRVEL